MSLSARLQILDLMLQRSIANFSRTRSRRQSILLASKQSIKGKTILAAVCAGGCPAVCYKLGVLTQEDASWE